MENKIWIAGPCVIESETLCEEVLQHTQSVIEHAGFEFVFKASYDKANRTSASSPRGLGVENGLSILKKLKNKFQCKILTDVHAVNEVEIAAAFVDVIQIPAFLCRQTDLLHAAGRTGKIVNIKKGQFMNPDNMGYAVDKVIDAGGKNVWLTERGNSFGYNDLIVDFRSLVIMKKFAPVIFDATHSVQAPGNNNGKSGGNVAFALPLAKAAAAIGVDGIFTETHPNPTEAWSDGPNMIPLNHFSDFVSEVSKKW
jgi:2-dehydro-3-deoxyphosphooctonate aldolase (KDO 8-P synthase)